jgi:putative ABC transport system permease protein
MDLSSDLRAAGRAIGRAPFVPAAVAGLTAVGLGLVLGMWAIIDAALLRPLPLPEPGQLVVVWETHAQRGRMSVAPANFLDWSSAVRSFSAVAGQQALDATLGSGSTAQRLNGVKVTPTYFDVWQLPALRGRTFGANDFRDDARVALLSARVWRQTFGGADGVVGSTVRIDGEPYTVVGIMPPEASVVGRSDVWMPWVFSARERTERRFHQVGVFARLRPGMTAARASAEMASIYEGLAAAHPDTTRDWSARAEPMREVLVEVPQGMVRLLGGAVMATMIVAMLNIAALLLGWWPRRRSEFATRRALGAGTVDIVRQLTVEATIMLTAGAAAGFGLARAFIDAFGSAVAPSTSWFVVEPRLDGRLALTALVIVCAVILSTIVVPAWRMAVSSGDLTPRRSPAATTAGLAAIALQVGAAFVLLVTSAALLDSARRLTTLVPAVVESRIAVEVSLADARYPEEADQRAFFTRLIEAVRALPDVADVGAASYVPPTDALGNIRFDIEGRPDPSDTQTAAASAVDERAFHMLGLRLRRGRLLDARDTPQSPPAAVISESLAVRYWPESDPLGAKIRLVGMDAPHTVVGVVSDVRRPLSSAPRAETVLYFAYTQVPWPFMTLIVEPRADTASAVAGFRRELARIDPDQAAGPVRSLVAVQSEWLVQPHLQGTLVTLFGVSTLLLTLAGLYARVTYGVAHRARECAVRQALGATPPRVVWLLVQDVATGAAGGLLLGITALPVLAGAVAHLAFDVSLTDASRAGAAALAVSIAIAIAVYLPARALSAMNLADTLRAE